MKLTKIVTAVVALALFASTATAGVVAINVAQSPAEAAGAGYVANDISVDFNGNLRGQQLFIQLTAGEVFNDATLGADTPPNSALFGTFAALEFDSFVSIGGLDTVGSEGVLVVGGAVDIPGAPQALSLGGQTVSIAWAPATGVDVPNGTNYPVARITLSPDAQGTAFLFGSTSGGDAPFVLSDVAIVNGAIGAAIIPEPASLALASLAVLGMTAIRRRS